MDARIVRLWTIQSPAFPIDQLTVDLSKSPYCDEGTSYKSAHQELAKRIGRQSFLWCYTTDPTSKLGEVFGEHVLWSLNVPQSSVIAYIDGLIWNRVLGTKCGLLCVGDAMDRCADQVFEFDAQLRGAFREAIANAYWSLLPPKGNWWEHLMLEPPRFGELVTALIPCPIKSEWIVERKVVGQAH